MFDKISSKWIIAAQILQVTKYVSGLVTVALIIGYVVNLVEPTLWHAVFPVLVVVSIILSIAVSRIMMDEMMDEMDDFHDDFFGE